ncbi:signal peptidase I [bacterium]|nr:signal peptidase I [bacterium]
MARKRKKRKKEKSKLREWVETIVSALIIALILRTFVVQAYRIPTGSMEDTLLIGDFLLGEKITYRFRDPRPGEVVIFKYPLNPRKDYVKRCVAVGGQTVFVRDKVLFVDGVPFPDPPGVKYIDPEILPSSVSNRDNFGPYTVPAGYFFMMGDNRDNSADSRFWGPLAEKFIRAKPLIIYFSWSPDPNAPDLNPPYIIDLIRLFFYDLFHFPVRVRWKRIGRLIR